MSLISIRLPVVSRLKRLLHSLGSRGWGKWRRGSLEGFTFIEVVVALTIISIGLTLALQAYSYVLNSSSLARTVSIATILAESKSAEIENGLEDGGDGNFEGEFSGFHWEKGVSGNEADEGSLVEVTWKEGGHVRKCTLALPGAGAIAFREDSEAGSPGEKAGE